MQVQVQEVWSEAQDCISKELPDNTDATGPWGPIEWHDLITDITAIVILSPTNSLSVRSVTNTLTHAHSYHVH